MVATDLDYKNLWIPNSRTHTWSQEKQFRDCRCTQVIVGGQSQSFKCRIYHLWP